MLKPSEHIRNFLKVPNLDQTISLVTIQGACFGSRGSSVRIWPPRYFKLLRLLDKFKSNQNSKFSFSKKFLGVLRTEFFGNSEQFGTFSFTLSDHQRRLRSPYPSPDVLKSESAFPGLGANDTHTHPPQLRKILLAQVIAPS